MHPFFSLLVLGASCSAPSAPVTSSPDRAPTEPPPSPHVIDVPRVVETSTAAPSSSVTAPPIASVEPQDEPWPTFARASREDLPPARTHKTYDKDAAEMTAAMQPLFRTCYRRALREDRKIEGSARLLIRISRGGYVESAEVMESSGLSQRLLTCCVEAAVSRKFPDPGGDVVQIVAPLKFVPKD